MKILVIEDEKGIAGFIKQGLEEESYIVDVLYDGNRIEEIIDQEQYNLFLLDWMLPHRSGLELCKIIRTKDKSTPIIFLTAKDTIQDTVQALRGGANDYIKKPFHFEELLERIRVQLRPSNTTHEILKIADIKLDVTAHQVWKAENEILLTNKEFSLLEFLLRNKGRVCSRTRIIESVWGIHFEYNTGIIDVYINALRNKLKLTKSENYIQTVRGIGYVVRD